MWAGPKAGLNILYSVEATNGTARSFSITQPALLLVSVSNGRSSSSGSDVYAAAVVNGVVCARDRFYESGATKYASASCNSLIPPGDYVVTFADSSYVSRVNIVVIAI